MADATPTPRKRTSVRAQRPTNDNSARPRRSKLGVAMLGLTMFGVGGVIGFGGHPMIAKTYASPGTAIVSPAPSNASLMASAIKAVERTMPNAYVVGAGRGPAQTTKVLVQIPGAPAMQSVYVLSDGETVFSGVVLESMAISNASDSAPGASLQRDSGSADAHAKTASQQPSSTVSGSASIQGFEVDAQGNPILKPTPGLPEGVPATLEQAQKDTSEATVPAPVPAPSAGLQQGVAAESTVEPVEQASSSAPREAASEQPGSVPAPFGVQSSGLGEPGMVIENIDSLVGAESFGNAVRTMLSNDQAIDSVRAMAGTQEQQQGYFDLVTNLSAITQGKGPRHIYVMFDANCPVCHAYYNEVYEDIQRGRVTVHWIPAVVFPEQRSSLSGSAIMIAEADRSAEAGSDMLHRIMTQRGYLQGLDSSDRVNGVTPYLESVVKNTAVMAMARPETPLVIYKDGNDNLSIESGIPTRGYLGKVKVQEDNR